MTDFVNLLKASNDFFSLEGANKDSIIDAENALSLHFSNEYKKYLEECGAAAVDSHEFTGLANSVRLNVVNVTERVREKFPELPKDLYVVEELQIDGIMILQSSDGTVYESANGSTPVKIYGSLQEYLESIEEQ